MSFLSIPLILVLVAAIGIVVIVWRKMSFLRKLTPESHEMGGTWFHDMAPEVVEWFHRVPWKQYLHNILIESEKFVRRIRLVFMAIDRSSEQLVRKIRRVHQETAKEVQAHQEQQQAKEEEKEKDPDEIDMEDPEQLKGEEQRLIVAIAQNPKEAVLYSDLAKVYMKMHTYADAIEALSAAAKLEPENEGYTRRLGVAKKRLISVEK